MSIQVKNDLKLPLFPIGYVVGILVFLFPIFSVGVKSWTSTLHVLIFFTSIYWIFKKNKKLNPALTLLEKIFIASAIFIFIWYIFIEIMNGWQNVKSHWPLIEFRYVMIVPIFLMLRNIPDLDKWLIKGAILGCIFVVSYATFQTYYLETWRPHGAYNILFYGPVSAIMSLLILYSNPQKRDSLLWKFLAYFAIICGVVALAMSSARGGMLAFMILFALYPLLTGQVTVKRVAKYLVSLAVISVSIFYLFNPVRIEVQQTVDGLHKHLQHLSMTKENFHKSKLDSITKRFEMWRVALEISNDHKLFGVGRSGYERLLKEKIANGEVHPDLTDIDQPHNAYLNYLVARGYIGLLLFISILLIPTLIFLNTWNTANVQARLGISFITFFSIVSLTQSSVFARGHYLSFFLVVLVILLSSCINASQKSNETAI